MRSVEEKDRCEVWDPLLRLFHWTPAVAARYLVKAMVTGWKRRQDH